MAPFRLDVVYDWGYGLSLHTADGSESWLGSDGMIPTWSSAGWTKRFSADLAAEIARDGDDFYRVASTIGGYIVFPCNRMGQTGWTINQARGMHSGITDRFDPTLECIRRHYTEPSAENPFGERLAHYADFFEPFGEFGWYVRFFLLDDLLTEDRAAVRSLMSGAAVTDFTSPAFALTPGAYAEYRRRSLDFVSARNNRIRQLAL